MKKEELKPKVKIEVNTIQVNVQAKINPLFWVGLAFMKFGAFICSRFNIGVKILD